MAQSVGKSSVVVPHSLDWPRRAMAAFIYGLIQGVAATLRFRLAIGVLSKEPAIFCTWHNRLALSLPVYRRLIRPDSDSRRLAAIVSASKDGAVVAEVLEHFGVQPVRGSSSRRGSQALLELTTWAERGFDIAITPDGPRGPCYVVQDGAIALAQLTGLPVVPVCFYMSPKIRLKSWDRFQIPMPFGRCEVSFGEPIRVARDVSDSQRAALRQELEKQMRRITKD